MNESLLRFDKKQKYLVMDTETEGLNLLRSKPWQVSWVVCQGEEIIKGEVFDKFVRWKDLNVSKGAAKATGFNEATYRNKAEDPKVVWELFESYLYNPEYKIVGHNLLGFDIYIINTWRNLIGLEPDYSYLDRVIDTLALARAIGAKSPVDYEDFIFWQYRWLTHRDRKVKCSIKELLKRYGIDHDENKLHNALYDIKMNYKFFRKQLFDIEL